MKIEDQGLMIEDKKLMIEEVLRIEDGPEITHFCRDFFCRKSPTFEDISEPSKCPHADISSFFPALKLPRFNEEVYYTVVFKNPTGKSQTMCGLYKLVPKIRVVIQSRAIHLKKMVFLAYLISFFIVHGTEAMPQVIMGRAGHGSYIITGYFRLNQRQNSAQIM